MLKSGYSLNKSPLISPDSVDRLKVAGTQRHATIRDYTDAHTQTIREGRLALTNSSLYFLCYVKK